MNHAVRSRPHVPSYALTVVVLATALIVSACAPAAGRPAEEFIADVEDVISEIAAFAVTLQPGTQMNFYSIDAIGDRFITISSESTLGYTLFFGRAATTITFTGQQRGLIAVIAASGRGTNAEDDMDRIIAHLARVFDRP